MSHLLSSREMSPGDLQRIRAMLEEQTASKARDSHGR